MTEERKGKDSSKKLHAGVYSSVGRKVHTPNKASGTLLLRHYCGALFCLKVPLGMILSPDIPNPKSRYR